MLRKLIAACLFGLISSTIAHASSSPDEGMWLPIYLKKVNEKKMQEMGLKLSADDIYNINHASLKDAVVRLGSGFCTAEIVSEHGLLFTNHHCGYETVAEHSDTSHNYLAKGFWAKNFPEELPNPGLTASILVYMEDVTASVNDALKTAGENEQLREFMLRPVLDSIKQAAIKGKTKEGYTAEVKSFYKGNEYYLMVYQTFRDIRLVAAPPSAIGKFGGETDNWMWPRHTGDFSILRIYADKDGHPADYSKDNLPYKPKTFFRISLKGVKEGDYAMVMGFPGSTDRYLTSDDIELDRDFSNPAVINVLGKQLAIEKSAMDADSVVKIAQASDYASKSNTYKYYLGEERLLRHSSLLDIKHRQEDSFNRWAQADPERLNQYGSVVSDIRKANQKYQSIEPALSTFLYGVWGAGAYQYAFTYAPIYFETKDEKKTHTSGHWDSVATMLRPKAEKYLKSRTLNMDKEELKEMLIALFQEVPDPSRPELINEIFKKYKDGLPEDRIRRYVDEVYKNSILLSPEKTPKFLKSFSLKKLQKDPLYHMMTSLLDYYFNELNGTYTSVSAELQKDHKLYVQGLREWQKSRDFYPDANSTLRLTYGKVTSYNPRDGVHYKYYTTYEGILEKNNPKDPEFRVPQHEVDLLTQKKFGKYAQNDTLRVDFLTNNDITGGNSGSPVLNAKGNLIGLAFDGNWEAMIGDLYVNPELNRTIAVDIRYVLWVIDYYAGASNLMSELRYEE